MPGLNVSLKLRASDGISRPADAGRKSLTGLKTGVSGLKSELAALGAARADIQKFRALKQTTAATRRELNEAQGEVGALAREIRAAESPSRDLENRFAAARRRAQDLSRSLDTQETRLRSVRSGLDRAGISTRELVRHTRDLTDRERELTGALKRREDQLARIQRADRRGLEASTLAGNMTFIGDATTQVADGLNRRLFETTDAAMDFESAFADVKKVVDFESPGALAQMKDDIRALTRDIPLLPAELAQIAAEGGAMGVDQDNLLAYTREAATMAVAYDMIPQAAGEAMAKLSEVTGIPINDISRLGDAINVLSDTTASKANETVRAMLRAASTGRDFGLQAQETAALAATMIAGGAEPEIAGTAIRSLLPRLRTATRETDEFKAALEEIGYTAEELEARIEENAQGALLEFLETLESLDSGTRTGILVDLFGREHQGTVATLVNGLDSYRASLERVNDEQAVAGSMQREFANRTATGENAQRLLTNSMREFKIVMGDSVLPALTGLMRRATGTMHAVTDWAEANPRLASTLMTIAFSIGAVLAVLGPLLMLASVGVGTWALFGMALARVGPANALVTAGFVRLGGGLRLLTARAIPAAIGALRALTVASLANPLVLIATGIALAGLLLIRYWKPVSAFFSGLFGGLMQGLAPIGEAFASTFGPVAGLFSPIIGGIKTLFGWLGRLIAPFEASAETMDGARSAGAALGRLLGGNLATAFRIATFAPRLLIRTIGGLWSMAERVWRGLANLFSMRPGQILSAAWSGLQAIAGGILGGVAGVAGAAWNGLKSLFSWSPTSVVARAWSGLQGLARSILGGVAGTARSAWSGLSRLFSWVPDGVVRGAWRGLKTTVSVSLDEVRGIAGRAWNGLKSLFSWRPGPTVRAAWQDVPGEVENATAWSLIEGARHWNALLGVLGYEPGTTVAEAWKDVPQFVGRILGRVTAMTRAAMADVREQFASPLKTVASARDALGSIAGKTGKALAPIFGSASIAVSGAAADTPPPGEPPAPPPPPPEAPAPLPEPDWLADLENLDLPATQSAPFDPADFPASSTTTFGDIHITINAAPGQSPREIAREVMDEIERIKRGSLGDV